MNLMHFLNDPFSIWFWLVWAIFLVWQNYAFTYVSRARNSASLKSHMAAALQSNGVWFLQTLFIFSAFKSILDGKYGYGMTAGAVLYYTAFTMAGSLWAHYRRLKKESGMSAVGASKKYVQITPEEWERVKSMAATAYDITADMIPAAGITAKKFDGAPVVTGLPEDPDPKQFMKSSVPANDYCAEKGCH